MRAKESTKRDRTPSSLSSAPPPASSEDYKLRMSTYLSKMGKEDESRQIEKRMSRGGSQSNLEVEGSTDDDSSETDHLVQLLALQSYHLPGNNWAQDWCQFMANNHPVFGICCHNSVHPIKSFTRIVALVGTVTFGLAITNLFYVFLLWNPEYDRVLATVTTDGGTEYVLTTGMLLLWTVGGGVHCAFNLAMWHIAACACCQSGGCLESCACCPSLGKKMIRVFIFSIMVFCVLIVILRVVINDEERENGYGDDDIGGGTKQGINFAIDDELDFSVETMAEFSFVLNYLVEMTLSLFVYYFIAITILFSGILACGYNIPVLGGRPYEVACEERRNSRRQKRENPQGSRIVV